MALVVQKYGGTSMGTIERIRNVAKRVAKTYDAGNDMVVVVSAMSGETNKLVALANDICEFPDNASAAAVAMAVGSSGMFSKFETTVLMTTAESMEAMKKAKSVSYAPPR